ncbi:uncharacterized protein LOC133461871 isoform X3 [Cololabis saira]|uniref:uncharacterized protein LOC133461871 isoform X3 n=1 Tax=Cololabis saira TaxID=129043 RepID=UPI002AD2D1BB|nr:uncharacterized protein LOC133461871 isoform X3 [Cololabis saira]
MAVRPIQAVTPIQLEWNEDSGSDSSGSELSSYTGLDPDYSSPQNASSSSDEDLKRPGTSLSEDEDQQGGKCNIQEQNNPITYVQRLNKRPKRNKKVEVTVKTCTKREENKRAWDKRHYCLYCGQSHLKMARHLQRKHSDIKNVAYAFSFPLGSKERKVLLEQLRNKGDFKHNTKVLEKGRGQLVTWKQPSDKASVKDYLPCSFCLGMFSKKDLWRHQSLCKSEKSCVIEEGKKTRGRVQSRAARLLPIAASSGGCQGIINNMRQDDVSFHIRSDSLICRYGDSLYAKHSRVKSGDQYIAQRMRQLGRFVLVAKDVDKTVQSLEDLCAPSKFQLVISVAKTLTKFSPGKNEYGKPSTAVKIGFCLKGAVEVLIGQALMNDDDLAEKKAKEFLELLEKNWKMALRDFDQQSSFNMGTSKGVCGGCGEAAFDDALDGLPSFGPEEDDEDWHFALPVGTLEQEGEESRGSANTSHSSQDNTPENSRASDGGVQNQAEETEDSEQGETSITAPVEDRNPPTLPSDNIKDEPIDDNIKDEPIDEGYDAALLPQSSIKQIKEEPDQQEEELKISSVYSVGGATTLASPSTPAAVPIPAPAPTQTAIFIPGRGAGLQAISSLPMRPPVPITTSLPTLAPMPPRPPQPPVPGSVRCSGCSKVLLKGQTAIQRKGSTQLFCSTVCLMGHVPPATKCDSAPYANTMEKYLKRKNEDDNPTKSKFMRKYNPDFIKYGFVNGGSAAVPRAKCVECGLTLSNEALKPSKLQRHLESKHPTLVGKPVEFFKRKEDGLQMEKKSISIVSLTGNSKCTLKASYLVARRVAQSKKAFTIAKELVLPSAVDMCHEMIGEAAAKRLLTIPLSNDTVSHRIVDMASDIQQQLIERVKSSPFFSLQLDESTDVTNATLLLVFVRYCWDNSLHEDILFCRELPTQTTAQECFRCMDNYFSENGMDWQNCVGVCSDGAASMTGKHHGVIRQILDRAPEAKWTHCFLRRESLAAKKMSEFHEVIDVSVKTINLIKNNAVNSRSFAELCKDMEADHIQLLNHSEVRWLSRGLLLNRLFELRNEVFSFLTEKKYTLAHHFANTKFTAKLAYLCDIFSLLNQLNISLQGRTSNIFVVANKVKAFKRKLALWTKRTQEKRMDMFPLLSDILEEFPHVNISDSVSQHLSQLAEKFDDYFPEDPREGHMWILDPFSVDPTANDVALPSHLESQLLEVSTDSTLKLQWGKLDLGSFWIAVSKEYPCLALRAVKQLLPFTTTYLCESGFSIVATTKTKARNRLRATLEATLRVSLSPIPPRLDLILSQKQAQVSH